MPAVVLCQVTSRATNKSSNFNARAKLLNQYTREVGGTSGTVMVVVYETTTITVGGVPPNNGNAVYWASTVNENPAPTSYKIEPISNLRTKWFMEGSGKNYTILRKKLVGIVL